MMTESEIQKAILGSNDVTHIANNCQYYKDTRGYERALRDILHCVSLFK